MNHLKRDDGLVERETEFFLRPNFSYNKASVHHLNPFFSIWNKVDSGAFTFLLSNNCISFSCYMSVCCDQVSDQCLESVLHPCCPQPSAHPFH